MTASPESHSAPAPRRRPLRILYADDVRELREVARISFGREGHHIECVDDGAEALAKVSASADLDLLITDHHMPRLNGLELVRALRTGPAPFDGKIIVFSSELSPEVAQQYREFAVNRILYKPVFPSQLREVLKELFPEPS
jgi:CheY-like chemotaxis protein